jgi:hypothetical protein
MFYIFLGLTILAIGYFLFFNMMGRRLNWIRRWMLNWCDLLTKTSEMNDLSIKEILLVNRALHVFPDIRGMQNKFWIWNIEKFVVDREAFNFILEKNNVQINRDFSKEF